MKHCTIIILLMLLNAYSYAQQEAHYSHFMFNQTGYNPAYCGTDGVINGTLIYRDQWMGLEGGPKTMMLTADMPINFLGRQHGVGFTMANDDIGFETSFTAKAAYSHHIQVGTGIFAIGLDLGLYNKSIDGDWQFPDEEEAIFQGKTRKMIFDLGAGIYYNIGDLSLGLSSAHIHEPELDFSEDGQTYLARHYFFTSSYNISLPNSLFDLTPSIILMSDMNAFQFDINLNVLYNKKVWGGVTYRNEDAITLLAGATVIGDFKIGAAYEIGISKLKKTNVGSFELMLGYSFVPEKSKPAQKVRSVRFL